MERVALNRNEYGEPERTQEHGGADGAEDEQVVAVGYDAVGVRSESGVVEGGDSVENAMPESLVRCFTEREESRGEEHGNERFDGERRVRHCFDDAANLAESANVQVFLRNEFGAQTHFAADSQRQQGGDGQRTQATHLAGEKNHCLTEG